MIPYTKFSVFIFCWLHFLTATFDEQDDKKKGVGVLKCLVEKRRQEEDKREGGRKIIGREGGGGTKEKSFKGSKFQKAPMSPSARRIRIRAPTKVG